MFPFNQLAIANSAAILQQQLLTLNPLAAVNPTAFLQQQQLLQLSQLAATNPQAYLQQPIVGSSIF
jgi:hypothetical protein